MTRLSTLCWCAISWNLVFTADMIFAQVTTTKTHETAVSGSEPTAETTKKPAKKKKSKGQKKKKAKETIEEPQPVLDPTVEAPPAELIKETNINSIIWAQMGYLKPLGDMKALTSHGFQTGLEWDYLFGQSRDTQRFYMGLIFRRSHIKFRLNEESKSTHTRMDFLTALGFQLGSNESLKFFLDGQLGFGVRRLYIDSGNNQKGDDYNSQTALAYGFRTGIGHNITENLAWRLNAGALLGSKLTSSRLRFNGEEIDLNGMQVTGGFELGLCF